MLNVILEELKKASPFGWEVTDTQTLGWEFYLIRHRLDQNRVKRVEHIWVKVFEKSGDGQFLGSAAGEIPPTASREEAAKLIAQLKQNAALVKNPAYELNRPSGKAGEPAEVPDPAPIAKEFLSVLSRLPETEKADLNSAEIFVSSIRRRLITSEGIDVTSVFPSSMLEAVLNARQDGHEIELYRMYESGACDGEETLRRLTETLRFGEDRLKAVPTPALGKADVLFSTDAAAEIYRWFILRMNAALKFRRLSDWEIGKDIAPEATGDKVTVRAVKELPNSSENAAYDGEGAPVRDEVMLENNVPRHFLGSRQFSQYLGLSDSFIPGNYAVSGGTAEEQELRAGDHLEIVEFSDFQVHPVTGDIAGEIRLGYLRRGGKTTVVTGGSVSGSMNDFVKTLRMSKESRQYNNTLIPSATMLKDVTVTGAE